MLIKEKLPQGHPYPQITHAPIDYTEFLNFFRGGHTKDGKILATGHRGESGDRRFNPYFDWLW
jgi:hypothetical protein